MTKCQRAVNIYPIATTPFIQVHIQREAERDRERPRDRDRLTDRERAFAAVEIDPAHPQTHRLT